MWFHNLLAASNARHARSRRPRQRSARAGLGRTLERLEDRRLLTNYAAASVADLIADINAANSAGGANTITLAAPTTSPYVLTAVNNTTNGSTGLPVVAAKDNLTILGNGDTIERSTAAGTPAFRLVEVASAGSLTLENLTLQGGMIEGEFSGLQGVLGLHSIGAAGAGIYSEGTLLLNGVTVQDNVAGTSLGISSSVPAAAGGGIFSLAGSVTLEGGTVVQNNEAIGGSGSPNQNSIGGNAYGGGLFALCGTVTMTNATVDDNSAEGGIGGGPYGDAYGGGLYASSFGRPGATVVTLTNATLDGNTAKFAGITWPARCDTYGGGLYLGAPYQGYLGEGATTATLTNCNVQGNWAVTPHGFSEGGGLMLFGATAALTNCTVQDNSVVGLGTIYSQGGGLYVLDSLHSTVTLVNDTVQDNSTLEFALEGAVYGYSISGYGGGIYIFSGATVYLDSFTVANTINNTDSTGLNGSTANIDGPYILKNP